MFKNLTGIAISNIACALPKTSISVKDYAAGLLDERAAKRMSKGTGFVSLRISPNNVTSADLCVAAAKNIFANYDKRSIDAVIFVTQTPDYYLPATSHVIQNILGLNHGIFCLDVNEGCSGYVHGLYLASLLVNANQCKRVLLLAGDTISKLTSPNDRATRCIFGDAGTASIIESGVHSLSVNINTYGERAKAIIVENSRHRTSKDPILDKYLYLDGMGIMNFTLNEVPENIEALLKYTNLCKADITLFACHQANKLILASLAEKLQVPNGKLPFIAENIGNTSSASIPILLNFVTDKSKLKKVLCSGFGVGLSVESCIYDFSDTKFAEMVEL
jgi:3-oxoacyl-[acyl-carrier-protein] synthase-3